MVGRITEAPNDWGKYQRYFMVEGRKSALYGLSTYVVDLAWEKAFLAYRLGKAVTLWREHRVSRLLLSGQSPYRALLEGLGFSLYEPLAVLQTLGDRILLQELQRLSIAPEVASVKLCGEYCTNAMTVVALALCPQVATVGIDARGACALETRLYQEFGMAVPSLEQQYTATICFSSAVNNQRRGKTGVFLQLDSCDSPDFCGLSPKINGIPEDVPPLSLLALLMENGKITKEEIDFT